MGMRSGWIKPLPPEASGLPRTPRLKQHDQPCLRTFDSCLMPPPADPNRPFPDSRRSKADSLSETTDPFVPWLNDLLMASCLLEAADPDISESTMPAAIDRLRIASRGLLACLAMETS